MTDSEEPAVKQTNPISNDALFAEPFKPAWMRRQEEDQRMELEWYVTKGIQIEWKKVAEESRRKLAEKYPPKKRRANSGQVANVDDNTSE